MGNTTLHLLKIRSVVFLHRLRRRCPVLGSFVARKGIRGSFLLRSGSGGRLSLSVGQVGLGSRAVALLTVGSVDGRLGRGRDRS